MSQHFYQNTNSLRGGMKRRCDWELTHSCVVEVQGDSRVACSTPKPCIVFVNGCEKPMCSHVGSSAPGHLCPAHYSWRERRLTSVRPFVDTCLQKLRKAFMVRKPLQIMSLKQSSTYGVSHSVCPLVSSKSARGRTNNTGLKRSNVCAEI